MDDCALSQLQNDFFLMYSLDCQDIYYNCSSSINANETMSNNIERYSCSQERMHGI